MHRLNGHARKKAPDPTSDLDDGSGLADLLRAFYEQLIEDAFGDAADVGIDVAFSLDNPFVQDVLEGLASQIASVADTTRQDVRDLVGRQAAEGWSMEELQKQIRAKGEIASRDRALTIARTESARAYTEGSRAAYKASGVVSQVTWLIGPDSCDLCAPLDGMIVGIDEEFAPGISGPPLHPNCTCALSPVIAE